MIRIPYNEIPLRIKIETAIGILICISLIIAGVMAVLGNFDYFTLTAVVCACYIGYMIIKIGKDLHE